MPKGILKFFRAFFTIIFTFTYFVSLSFLLTLFVFKTALKNDMIKEIILSTLSNTRTVGYLSLEDKTLAYIDIDDTIKEINQENQNIEIDGELEEFINDSFRDVLRENNIPEDALKYVLENEENKEIIASLIQESINYTYGLSDSLKLNEEDINKLVNNSIDKYEEQNNVTIERSGINNLTKQFTKEYKEVIDSTHVDNMQDIKNLINIIINGPLFSYALGICIVSFILLIVINVKNFKVVLNLAIPLLIHSITYFISYIGLKNLDISKNLYSLQNSILKVSILVGVIGLILLGIYIIIKNRNEEKEIVL